MSNAIEEEKKFLIKNKRKYTRKKGISFVILSLIEDKRNTVTIIPPQMQQIKRHEHYMNNNRYNKTIK